MERQCTGKHFIHENTKTPPIGSWTVSTTGDDFRRHVLHGPAKGIGLGAIHAIIESLLGQAKVCQLNVPLLRQKNAKLDENRFH